MVFDWDDAKDEATRVERGFGFADAAGIFLGRRIEWQDSRRNYGEVRMVTVGESDGLFYAVVYTDRQDADGQHVRRLISARLANKKERKAWRA
ncbi:BrnT family toxin [Methylobacterium sp. NPDC080182]|uniref:BrnT family toxin n=1 Tax=Methylobacterium sp. NPDC080182 TaxID=3390590 RepID=UPI003D01FB65